MAIRIVVTGKGGSGKTTIAALLSIIFSENGYRVLALDTDSVPNLAQTLGIPLEEAEKIVPLVRNYELIEERTGVKPGERWGLLFSLTPRVDDLVSRYGIKINDNLTLVVVGSIDSGKEGCLCPAIALARALLLHIAMRRGREVVIVDSEAGAEVFGRGLAEKFDLNITVSEPTLRSMIIAHKLIELAKDLGIKNSILVINKVIDRASAIELYSRVFNNNIPYHIVSYDPNLAKIETASLNINKVRNSQIFQDVLTLFNKISKITKL